jgi:hypothetical protein
MIVLSSAPSRAGFAQAGATVRVVGADGPFGLGETIRLDVEVDGAADLGGFQVILSFDREQLDFESAEPGEWLGSSGREVLCPDPQVDASVVLLRCVTLRESPAGVTGSGVLYHVNFVAKSEGSTEVTIARARLLHPDATDLSYAVDTNGSQIVVGGDGRDGLSSRSLIAIIAIATAVLGGLSVALVRFRRPRMEEPEGG